MLGILMPIVTAGHCLHSHAIKAYDFEVLIKNANCMKKIVMSQN